MQQQEVAAALDNLLGGGGALVARRCACACSPFSEILRSSAGCRNQELWGKEPLDVAGNAGAREPCCFCCSTDPG